MSNPGYTAIDGGLFIESGCAPLADRAERLDPQLTGITVTPMRISVTQTHCAPGSEQDATCPVISTRTATVAGTITGVGNVQKTEARSSYSDGIYIYTFRDQGRVRAAPRAASPWMAQRRAAQAA